jgi:MraZ protein
MTLLIGRYEYTLDPKNRLGIPPKFKEALSLEKGERFYITSGLEGCLYLFLPSQWNRLLENNLQSLSLSNTEEERAFKRKFFAEAVDIELDGVGRVLLPQYLKIYAGLGSTILVQGAGTRAEIWDAQRWQAYNRTKAEPAYRQATKSLKL